MVGSGKSARQPGRRLWRIASRRPCAGYQESPCSRAWFPRNAGRGATCSARHGLSLNVRFDKRISGNAGDGPVREPASIKGRMQWLLSQPSADALSHNSAKLRTKHLKLPFRHGCRKNPGRPNGLFGIEFQGSAVDAIAQACWLGTIRKDMTKMCIAPVADNFGSPAKERMVRPFLNRIAGRRLPEGRPSCPGIELGSGIEEIGFAAHAFKHSCSFWKIVVCERALGCRFPGNPVGQIRKLFTPFRVGFHSFFIQCWRPCH